MKVEILLPSSVHKSGQNWSTSKRARVCQVRANGKSWKQIFEDLGVPKSTVQRICKAKSSRTTRKGKQYQKRRLIIRWIRQIIRVISQNWSSRCMTFKQVRRALNIPASVRTIRRELRRAGYRRCVACPRPFISRA